MARRIGEPIMVRATEGGAPGTFLWRDRIYVVKEVLGHWRERRSWWAGAAARAVHGDVGDAVSGSIDHEREVWRVEASAGRMFARGVYDLAHDDDPRWHLLRVAD